MKTIKTILILVLVGMVLALGLSPRTSGARVMRRWTWRIAALILRTRGEPEQQQMQYHRTAEKEIDHGASL